MTYAFVDDRFPTGWGATGWPCAAAIRRLLDVARPLGVPVFYSTGKLAHSPGRARALERDLDLHRPPRAPAGAEIVPEIAPQEGESVVTKRYPSAFFGTELASLLTYHQIDTLIVTGMVTSGCVRATAIDAFSYNYIVVVPEECAADRAVLPHKLNLFDIHMKYGDVMPLDPVLDYLRQVAAPQPVAAARR